MFLKNVESILKDFSARNLKTLEFYHGVELELYRAIKDTHTKVYGSHAGNKVVLLNQFVGILSSDDFFTSSSVHAGNFEEGFLYTSFKDVNIADIIRVKSSDAKNRRFKVISKETIGTQDSVFERWKITNIAD